MEETHYDKLWSHGIPSDILELISSRLVAAEYFVFHAVCKRWCYAPLTPPSLPPRLMTCSPTPRLMTLWGETGIVEFFDPVYNVVTTQKTDIPKLRGARIRSSKANWLLISSGSRGMFFFNPISNDIIELPDLLEEHENSCSAWTFSCPPDSSSSDCFVVGFETGIYVPDVYIIKVGDTEWTHHYFFNTGNFATSDCNNPLFFKNNTIYLLGDKGNLGTLCIKGNSATQRPNWKFYGRHFPSSKQTSIRKAYTAEDVDNGGMLVVFLSREEGDVEVWRYKLKGKVLEREQLTSLDNNKTLFVSSGGSYLKTCVAQGLGNKIYFPMFHDNNKSVFYCLANRKYYSFDYSAIKAYSSSNIFNLVQPRSCIWIEKEND
ncbi:F-box protein At4g00893-like [Solanum tuberosum]|uniref:F-box protein family n=1 Tax=Solanum tuberosum TaxID=4113 RepID=M1DTI2_SOLTU|nr:PREDICTED: F-box protein At4g00893-like [Solanum tuberosum]